jgi:hypothetical protein
MNYLTIYQSKSTSIIVLINQHIKLIKSSLIFYNFKDNLREMLVN